MDLERLYKITDVLDRETNEKSKEWSYRIGRVGFMALLEKGKGLIFMYPDNRHFRTTKVEDYKIDGVDKITVTTNNRIYKFEIVANEQSKEKCA